MKTQSKKTTTAATETGPESITPKVSPAPLNELKKFKAYDADLAKLRAAAIERVAIGTPNRAEYEITHKLVMVAVKVRTDALKLAKELAADYKAKADAILAEGKRVADDAKQTEALIRPLKEAFEEEEDRRKAEALQAEAVRLSTRINALNLLEATFDGLNYHILDVTIEAIEVRALPDEEFRELLDKATAAYNAQQIRIAELERQRREEAEELERKRIEQVAEAARLLEEKEQQEREKKALAAEREALNKQRFEVRKSRLEAVGFDLSNNEARLDYLAVDLEVVSSYSEEEFGELLKLADEIERRRLEDEAQAKSERDQIEAANKAISEKLADRLEQLGKAGYTSNGPYFDLCDFTVSKESVLNYSEEEFTLLIVTAPGIKERYEAAAAERAAQAEQQAENAGRLTSISGASSFSSGPLLERKEGNEPAAGTFSDWISRGLAVVAPMTESELDENLAKLRAELDKEEATDQPAAAEFPALTDTEKDRLAALSRRNRTRGNTERESRLAADKETLEFWIGKLKGINDPTESLNEPEAISLAGTFLAHLLAVADAFSAQLNEL